MRLLLLLVGLVIAVIACDSENGPPLEISNVSVFAPLPGTGMSAAYLTMRNNTDTPILIGLIKSPQFDSIALHETRIVDGVAKMRMLEALAIPARSEALLTEGGMHLMLSRPVNGIAENDPVTLQFAYDVDGLVIVNTIVRSRFSNE
jgi:copper(I)-binding protein